MTGLILASITTTLTDGIARHGAYIIFLIMALDAVLPVGGELTMLYAGALGAGAIAGYQPILLGHTLHHGLEAYLVLALVGTLGYTIGALGGWAIGRWGGRSLLERHGRWLHLDATRLARAELWFERRGRAAVFLGRLTPLVRSFISIPAGTLESPLAPYTVLTFAGSAIWCFAFAGAGWALGSNYDQVHHVFTAVEILIVVGLLAGAAVLLRRRRGRRRASVAAGSPDRP